eukprot:913009_1
MKRERSDDESESGNAPEKRKKHSLNAAMRLTVVKNSVHLSAVSEDGIPSLEASLNEGSSTDLPLESGQEVTIKRPMEELCALRLTILSPEGTPKVNRTLKLLIWILILKPLKMNRIPVILSRISRVTLSRSRRVTLSRRLTVVKI